MVLICSMLSRGATYQSQVVEVPMAIWPEHLVMKSALAVVAKPSTVAVLTAQQPPNTVFWNVSMTIVGAMLSHDCALPYHMSKTS
jgi:hypothetical protein